MSFRRFSIVAAVAVQLLGTGLVSAADHNTSPPLTFAVIPYYAPEKIWTLFTPFVEHVSESTGVKLQHKVYSNHDDVINGLCSGEISIALLGPIPLARANKKCGVTPFLVALNSDGKPTYRSVMLSTDRKVRQISDLKGKAVGFFKGSTAAHIVPVDMMARRGVSMKDIRPVFLESQDKLITSLLSGEISAAGVKEALYKKTKSSVLRVIETSDPLPNFALCARPSLLPSIRASFQDELVSHAGDHKHAILAKQWDDEVKNGFVIPDKSFMTSVMDLHDTYQKAGQ